MTFSVKDGSKYLCSRLKEGTAGGKTALSAAAVDPPRAAELMALVMATNGAGLRAYQLFGNQSIEG